MRANKFDTVVGAIAFGKDGEWTQARQFTTQVQNVAPNNLDQFRDGSRTPILWPPEYKNGNIIYPYVAAQPATSALPPIAQSGSRSFCCAAGRHGRRHEVGGVGTEQQVNFIDRD